MGMFDYIIIDDPIEGLPEGISDERPQTKSLENTMTKFIIRDGQLLKIFQKWEDTDKIAFETEYHTFYEKRLVEEWTSPYPYHGDIDIVAWTKDDKPVRLTARFSYDELDYIKVDEEATTAYRERWQKTDQALSEALKSSSIDEQEQ